MGPCLPSLLHHPALQACALVPCSARETSCLPTVLRCTRGCRYVYTAEDVAKMVEDKRAAGNVRNLAKEKSRLVVRRAKALEDNDREEAER